MRYFLFLVVLVSALFAVACSAAPVELPLEVDLTALPAEIDVATAAALNGRSDVLLIDVRELWEYDEGHIPGIALIPMGEIPARLSEIPTDIPVIVTCRSGNRSGQVTQFLRQEGFTNVHNMDGGILAWQAAGFPVEN